MSAQSAPLKPTAEPVTPVIIKVGGDLDPAANVATTSSPVNIESASLSFAETVPGPTWASSLSTSPGRIINLTIIDGFNTISLAVTPTSKLASVTIGFGPAQLVAMESHGPAESGVFLLIMSNEVPFDAGSGDWKTSATTFPNKVKSVAFTVGEEQQLNYEFQTQQATVQIDFDLTHPK
jgi:hypothetical protein